MFIKYCVFSLKLCDFSELCQFCCSAGVLSAISWSKHEVRCTHRGKTERGQSLEYIFKFSIFNEHPVRKTLVVASNSAIHISTCLSFLKITGAVGGEGLSMFYSPDIGDLPEFDLPDDLELPNIAAVSYIDKIALQLR